MSVQVVYKNTVKLSNSEAIALFCDENFNIKPNYSIFNKDEIKFISKILKTKKNKKEAIFSINVTERKTAVIIKLKNNISIANLENSGAKFYDYAKKKFIKKYHFDQW